MAEELQRTPAQPLMYIYRGAQCFGGGGHFETMAGREAFTPWVRDPLKGPRKKSCIPDALMVDEVNRTKKRAVECVGGSGFGRYLTFLLQYIGNTKYSQNELFEFTFFDSLTKKHVFFSKLCENQTIQK